MKLSEAIRLGAMVNEQAFDWEQWPGKGCALQVALHAVGFGGDYSTAIAAAYRQWPDLPRDGVPCPVVGGCGWGLRESGNGISAVAAVAHLNDQHRWSRERIADWVETVETDVRAATDSTPEETAVL